MYLSLTSHLDAVAILPCEIQKSKMTELLLIPTKLLGFT